MNIIYFSHSYRDEDNNLVKHFGQLIKSQNLFISLDPPARSINAAKLERHLNDSNGMVSILTRRKSGVSAYILFEISLCLRARKPLLVFIEDDLENNIIPSRILQSRFSKRFYRNQIIEHQHVIQSFKTYLGNEPIPKYQPSIGKKSCLLVGSSVLEQDKGEIIENIIKDHCYDVLTLDETTNSIFQSENMYETLCSANLAICFVDSKLPMSHYLIGAIQTSIVPTILLTVNPSYNYKSLIPREFQPRFINTEDVIELRKTIDNEISLFEDQVIGIDDDNTLNEYSKGLLSASLKYKGNYDNGVKNFFVNNYKINGQQNIIGSTAYVHDISFNQIWNETKDRIDLNTLTEELKSLRLKLNEKAKTDDNYDSIANIAKAESSAKNGDGLKAFEYLQKAGKWALDVARKSSVPVTAEVLAKLLEQLI
jgi:hypothetical protein